MSSCTTLAAVTSAPTHSGGPALSATLLELLTTAHAQVEVDRQAAKASLSRATALLQASLDRESGPKDKTVSRGGLPRWQAKRVETYIEQNLEQPIRSPHLIALTGLSTGHFFRSFKETFGVAPFAYIARLRVERAKHLMTTTDRSICQIALDCGLCDQSHLTRVFRQLVGMTPGEWRRIYACDSAKSVSVEAEAA